MNPKKYAPIILRISLSLVFLWFGYTSIFNYEKFLGYVPAFAHSVPIPMRELLFLNGAFEIALGLFLLAGFLTRISALLLSLHTLAIMVSLGYNYLAVRDFCIALATLAVFINGEDEWCIDMKLKAEKKGFT